MKHLKMLGLFVMAAASLMAFAGSASAAATFTSPTGTEYTNTLSSSLEGSALLEAGFANITCTTSTVAGKITANDATEASGEISKVEFSNCGGATVDTLLPKGTLTITNGGHTVSGTGVEVTTAIFGTSCIYGLGAGTHLGTATNTSVGGVDTVTLDIDANLPKLFGGFLCASPATWQAKYIVTSPAISFVD